MNRPKPLNVSKGLRPFRILLSIAVAVMLTFSGTEELSAKPAAMSARTENEFHRNCSSCHIPSSDARDQHSTWAESSPRKSFAPNLRSSRLCLGCHDGMIAKEINSGESGQNSSGVDLNKSHPMSVDYMTAFSRKGAKRLRHPSTLGPLKLYEGKVECGSCHDTHQSFRLRMSKRDLCFQCHNA
jgi:predicted CXXCH cytochrome family protein